LSSKVVKFFLEHVDGAWPYLETLSRVIVPVSRVLWYLLGVTIP